ncbi:MAG: GntR family transcriptional regulator [Chloroflexota bacterium]
MEKEKIIEPVDLLERKSMREEIFDVLHKRIISGNYAPGEWLRQEDISTQLGVSQTPVREALDSLVSSGLAERIPYRGVRVLQLTTEEIVDSYAMRLLLESTAAAASARNRSQDDIVKLYEMLKKTGDLKTLNDMSAQMQINREFHHAIVAASGNVLLTRLYDITSHHFPDWMLYEYMFRYPALLVPSLTKEHEEHRAIVDSIAAGDAELVAQNVFVHIKNLGLELVQYLKIPQDMLLEKENNLLAFPHPALSH